MAKSTTKVILLGDHVYLPANPAAPDWETSENTIRYEGKTEGRRTRLEVHAGLAKFLMERGQAESVDDDPAA